MRRRSRLDRPAISGPPELLVAALEELSVPVALIGPDGLVRSNRHARGLQAIPEEPLEQDAWAARLDAHHPEGGRALALNELPLVRALRTGEMSSLELDVATSGQGRERVVVSGEPIRRAGQVVGALSVLRRAAADEAGSGLHAVLLRHAADGFAVICAATGTFVYTNDAWTNALGYAPGELVGLHVSSVNAPSDRVPQEMAGEMLEVLDRGEVWRGEVELRRRDGAAVWWEQTVSRYDDEQGRPAWLVVGRDATARRASATALRDGERRFRAAFDALPCAAAVADEDGRLVAVNDALAELAGSTRDQLLGRSVEALLPPVDLEGARALAASGRRGDRSRYRYAARCAGRRAVDVTTTIVRQVDGRFLQAVALVEPAQPSPSRAGE